MRYVTGLLLALALLAFALPVAAQGAGARRTLVRGVVIDELTRAPVAAAVVQLVRPPREILAAATTDGNGQFLIDAPAAGDFRLRTTRIGYESRDSTIVTRQSTDTITVEIRISPTPMMLDSVLVIGRMEERAIAATEQLIHGRLVDDETREPIATGTMTLLRANGTVAAQTISNAQGLFRLRSPAPGTYKIKAERIGYATAESLPLHLMLRDTVRLDFHLSTAAIFLNPIQVTASARPWLNRHAMAGMEDFFRRMAGWNRRGAFITRDAIDEAVRRHMETSRLIWEHTSMSNRPRLGCQGTAYWLDGGPYQVIGAISDMQPLTFLEAMEVYEPPTIPAELMTMVNGRMPCVVVALWSKRGR